MKIPKIAFVGGIATEKLRNCLIQFNSCSRAWDKKWNEKRNQICNRFFSRVPWSFAEQLVANIENYYFATSRNARTAAGRVLLHFLFLINSHSKLGATNFIFTISDSVSRIHQMRAIFSCSLSRCCFRSAYSVDLFSFAARLCVGGDADVCYRSIHPTERRGWNLKWVVLYGKLLRLHPSECWTQPNTHTYTLHTPLHNAR